DGRGAPVARQNRSVDVDGAATRDVEHGLGQDLAESDYGGYIRSDRAQPLRPARIPQSRRLEHRNARGHRALLDGRRLEVLAATGGLVGLGNDGGDGV